MENRYMGRKEALFEQLDKIRGPRSTHMCDLSVSRTTLRLAQHEDDQHAANGAQNRRQLNQAAQIDQEIC